ncbi:hypothetical protein L1987_13942 [Smallanthus sonchifolius]|uniref:Uncharacterized protein n=1 Tax=Smallanthus sonchifolius TaxID=185202 RepID=A0ACB9JIU5_9ASTR|nr:hypothetical protein L1987_13942 [Smallanthus sonchifolius]
MADDIDPNKIVDEDESSHNNDNSGKDDSNRHRTNDGEIFREETRRQISEEVAKAFEATIPVIVEKVQESIKTLMQDELAKLQQKEDDTNGKKVVDQDAPVGEIEKKRCIYKDFMACKPIEFQGEIDPLISHRWITDRAS